MGSSKRGDDAEGVNALDAIREAINFLKRRGEKIKIVTHPTWTSRGYVFVTKVNNQGYIVANSYDVDIACAAAYMNGRDIAEYTYTIPVEADPMEMQAASGGLYLCSYPLK